MPAVPAGTARPKVLIPATPESASPAVLKSFTEDVLITLTTYSSPLTSSPSTVWLPSYAGPSAIGEFPF